MLTSVVLFSSRYRVSTVFGSFICKVIIAETAINVGYSCQLLTDEMVDVFIVDASSYDEVQQQLLKFRDSIKIVNTFQPRSPNQMGANGIVDISDRSMGTSTPPQPVQPPAVSVVTFRWDDADTLKIHHKQRAR